MIRSSLESEIYILQGRYTRYQAGPDAVKKRTILIASAVTLLLVFAAYRLKGSSFQWGLFLSTIYNVDWRWLTLSIALVLLSYVGRAVRWEVMLRPLRSGISIRKLTSDTTIGFTAVVLLGRPGELVRPYLISLSTGLSFSSQMAAWILERILDLLAVLLLFGFALIRIPAQGLALGPGLRWVLGTGGYLISGLGALAVLLFIVFRNFSDAAQRRILGAVGFLPESQRKRIEKMLQTFSEGMESTRNGRLFALLLGYTALEWLIIVTSYYALLHALPATSTFSITNVVIMLGFVAFAGVVQIPGIGGGVQIASIVVLSEIYKTPMAAATAAALVIWIITFVVVVPVGFACAFHEGINWSKLKHLPQDVPL